MMAICNYEIPIGNLLANLRKCLLRHIQPRYDVNLAVNLPNLSFARWQSRHRLKWSGYNEGQNITLL